MKKRLLAVQGPLQFIAGFIAMEWYGKVRGETQYETVLLMYDFLMPEALEPEFTAVITRLASVGSWKRVVFIGASRMTSIMQGSYERSIAGIREALGESDFDEIFLARDFCGDGSPLLGNAYPDAQKVAYGDSFGLVADRAQFSDFDRRRPIRSTLSACKRLARRAVLGGHRRFAFDTAVLSLPLDLSKGELNGVSLVVPSKDHVQRTIHAIAATLDDLSGYCRSLLAPAGNGTSQLFLLSNLSASGLMSEENEIAMYTEVITTVAAPGDTVLLKVHPRSSRTVLDAVVGGIGDAFPVRIIDDAQLGRLPVELWTELIAASNVVAMFSTAAVNIKYIYDKEVVLPLNKTLIERYIDPQRSAYVAGVQNMIGQAVMGLESWDGESFLWKKYP